MRERRQNSRFSDDLELKRPIIGRITTEIDRFCALLTAFLN